MLDFLLYRVEDRVSPLTRERWHRHDHSATNSLGLKALRKKKIIINRNSDRYRPSSGRNLFLLPRNAFLDCLGFVRSTWQCGVSMRWFSFHCCKWRKSNAFLFLTLLLGDRLFPQWHQVYSTADWNVLMGLCVDPSREFSTSSLGRDNLCALAFAFEIQSCLKMALLYTHTHTHTHRGGYWASPPSGVGTFLPPECLLFHQKVFPLFSVYPPLDGFSWFFRCPTTHFQHHHYPRNNTQTHTHTQDVRVCVLSTLHYSFISFSFNPPGGSFSKGNEKNILTRVRKSCFRHFLLFLPIWLYIYWIENIFFQVFFPFLCWMERSVAVCLFRCKNPFFFFFVWRGDSSLLFVPAEVTGWNNEKIRANNITVFFKRNVPYNFCRVYRDDNSAIPARLIIEHTIRKWRNKT